MCLLSGGFLQLIRPILPALALTEEHVVCHELCFDSNGEYAGFRLHAPALAAVHHTPNVAVDKLPLLRALQDRYGWSSTVAIGDGMTGGQRG